jgi:hypothetical protein
MTGTCAACLHTNQSRSYLNHLVFVQEGLYLSRNEILHLAGRITIVILSRIPCMWTALFYVMLGEKRLT